MNENIKSVTLDSCVDGDTAKLNIDGQILKFRFIGIDTPESVHPKKKVEPFGKEASEYTCKELKNAKEILVEYEKDNKKDKYERELAWIWVDDELLQKKIIANGYGQVAYIYDKYKYTLNLCAIQKETMANKIGVWSQKSYKEGYCKNIDTDGISKDIILIKNDEVSIDTQNNSKGLTFIIIVVFILSLIFSKSYRKKLLKQAKRKFR